MRQRKEAEVLKCAFHREQTAKEVALEAHAFWMNVRQSQDGLVAPEHGSLGPFNKLGLYSAIRQGFKVFLWTYHRTIEDLPNSGLGPGQVILQKAHDILPVEQFERMLDRNWCLPNIADVVRFLALHSVGKPGWFIDCETVWLQTPTQDNLERDGHSTSTGEHFGTQLAKRRQSGDAAFWQTDYSLKPGERSYPIPPFYFVENSSVLQHMVGIASSALKGPPSQRLQ